MRIPTSVAAFDVIVNGGIPSGSVVILAGEPGAGNLEFSFTSAAKLSLARENESFRKFLIMEGEDICLPKGTLYISISKTREEILRAVDLTFNEDLSSAFRNNLIFRDLSSEYFRNSIVPRKWISSEPRDILRKKGNLLEEFVNLIDENAHERIVIVDSLTDLAISPRIEFGELVDVIKGLRRAAKKWNSVIYLLLTTGILEKREENLLFDSVDGVLIFEWQGSRYSKRFRYMYVLKFVGLMSSLEEERIARFNTTLDKANGFVVVNTEKIR
ncbi:MAG: recombinase RecA [Thermoplasmata archaeon]|nr:recombinase RecA [Thermoplasmata archaeon]